MSEVKNLMERVKNLIELYELYYISEVELLNAIPIDEIRKLRDTINNGG